MTKVRVEILSESSILDPSEVKSVIQPLQTQVRRDFAPAWGIDADLAYLPKQKGKRRAWEIMIYDDPDQVGDWGYHDVTSEGLPLGLVFVGVKEVEWTVTLSHELLEMLADPDANLYAQYGVDEGVLYPCEVCDPCEPDRFGYRINRVLVSDFVYPAWFESFHKEKGTRFDHRNLLRRPFSKLPGGDIHKFDIRDHHLKSHRKFAAIHLRNGHRMERRLNAHRLWRTSQVKFE